MRLQLKSVLISNREPQSTNTLCASCPWISGARISVQHGHHGSGRGCRRFPVPGNQQPGGQPPHFPARGASPLSSPAADKDSPASNLPHRRRITAAALRTAAPVLVNCSISALMTPAIGIELQGRCRTTTRQVQVGVCRHRARKMTSANWESQPVGAPPPHR